MASSSSSWKVCAFCQQAGHLIKDCTVFYDPDHCKLELDKTRNYVDCRYCHKNTHTIDKCEKLKKKRANDKKAHSKKIHKNYKKTQLAGKFDIGVPTVDPIKGVIYTIKKREKVEEGEMYTIGKSGWDNNQEDMCPVCARNMPTGTCMSCMENGYA